MDVFMWCRPYGASRVIFWVNQKNLCFRYVYLLNILYDLMAAKECDLRSKYKSFTICVLVWKAPCLRSVYMLNNILVLTQKDCDFSYVNVLIMIYVLIWKDSYLRYAYILNISYIFNLERIWLHLNYGLSSFKYCICVFPVYFILVELLSC